VYNKIQRLLHEIISCKALKVSPFDSLFNNKIIICWINHNNFSKVLIKEPVKLQILLI